MSRRTERHRLAAASLAAMLFGAAAPALAGPATFATAHDAYRAGNHAEAIRLFESGLKVAPNDTTAMFFLAESRLAAGDTKAAEALLRRLLARNDVPAGVRGHAAGRLSFLAAGGLRQFDKIQTAVGPLALDDGLRAILMSEYRLFTATGPGKLTVRARVERFAERTPTLGATPSNVDTFTLTVSRDGPYCVKSYTTDQADRPSLLTYSLGPITLFNRWQTGRESMAQALRFEGPALIDYGAPDASYSLRAARTESGRRVEWTSTCKATGRTPIPKAPGIASVRYECQAVSADPSRDGDRTVARTEPAWRFLPVLGCFVGNAEIAGGLSQSASGSSRYTVESVVYQK